MAWQRRASVVLVALAGMWLGEARAQTFTLKSFNTLRYSSRSSSDKSDEMLALVNQTTTGTKTVVVYQEIMALVAPVLPPPGSVSYASTTSPLGPGRYKEHYLMLMSPGVNYVSAHVASTAGFMRPPLCTKISVGTKSYWVVDFHAIWGKSQSQRTAEAALMGTVLNDLYNAGPAKVVAGGDWNLTRDQVHAQTTWSANPDDLTTVTRSATLSSSYDHCAWKPSTLVTSTSTIDPANLATWRSTVSDHIPIACDVQ